jgi:hypothetical protein
METILTALLAVALLVVTCLCVLLFWYQKKASRLGADLRVEAEKHASDVTQLTTRVLALETENRRLAKWEAVVDAEAKATEILQEAQSTLAKANADAARITADSSREADDRLTTARDAAEKMSEEAKEQAKTLKAESQAALDSTTLRVAQIIEAANKRAEEIGGSAYEAMKNASLYERTVRAMKNIIEGYGDQYIIPERSLLDDLADNFDHTEAGRELKRARETTKAMIRNGTAARCEYVEASRRDTAINFVVDAFNGKVDSILSRVRYDNAGTLEQEIRDAFTLVNFNGRAFREAHVTEEYLAARLDELKWAAIVEVLRLQERDEQRRIKEQIREEEKARREYERAMKDAAKEEEMLRKAMEKAQQRIDQATAEQKVKYEEQLHELAAKLQQAEERNQRALSMAQQTKRGHVYIISNVGSFGDDVYKIGLTRRLEPIDRIRELGDSSVPFEFDVHAMIFSEDAPALETRLHQHFLMMQMNKINHRKEFFRVDLKHIRGEVEKLGLSAKWTMASLAKEYHESLAVEKAIKDNPHMREAWIKRQLSLESCLDGAEETSRVSEDD